MRWSTRLLAVGLLAAVVADQAAAQVVMPVSHGRSSGPVYIYNPQVCPTPGQPIPISPAPVVTPSTPGTPTPGTPTPAPMPEAKKDGQPQAQPQPLPQAQQPQAQQAPSVDFAQAPSGGTDTGTGGTPTMFGDFLGVYVTRSVRVGSGSTVSAHIPVVSAGAFKIADNESPKPLDRVFFNYNYFNNINIGSAAGLPSLDLHRETVGFEKTFLNGDASIGMRLPFLQLEGDGSVSADGIGDLTIIFKYALINDCCTGNVVSAGLALTLPTGRDNLPGTGFYDFHPTLFQPYVGALINRNNLFVHGFSSVVFASEEEYPTLWFNDIGVGFWIYRDQPCCGDCGSCGDCCGGCERGMLAGIVPTAELHITTPLEHRGFSNGDFGVPDIFTAVGGVNVVLRGGSNVGLAVGVPFSGPRIYDMEFLARVNFVF